MMRRMTTLLVFGAVLAYFALAGFSLTAALAEETDPCPAQPPLGPRQKMEHVTNTTGDPYTYANAGENKTQANRDDTGEEEDPGKKKGTATACNEFWKPVTDPCGGDGDCVWRVRWYWTTSATLLDSMASNVGSGHGQGYAHIKLYTETHGAPTVLSCNSYTTSEEPDSCNKTGQSLTGPTEDKQKAIGNHISCYVQSFSKFDNEGKSMGKANSVYSDPTLTLTLQQLVSGDCGPSSGG